MRRQAELVIKKHPRQNIYIGIGCSNVIAIGAKLYIILPRNIGADRPIAALSTSKIVEFATVIRE